MKLTNQMRGVRDELAPARGVLVGLLLSLPFWLLVWWAW
jgi:hypothetical protein